MTYTARGEEKGKLFEAPDHVGKRKKLAAGQLQAELTRDQRRI